MRRGGHVGEVEEGAAGGTEGWTEGDGGTQRSRDGHTDRGTWGRTEGSREGHTDRGNQGRTHGERNMGAHRSGDGQKDIGTHRGK